MPRSRRSRPGPPRASSSTWACATTSSTYNDGANYDYAVGLQLFDGTIDGGGTSSYTYATNGGEGGTEANATIFEIASTDVPVVNLYTRDNGDSGEYFGSPLTSWPAWLR